jgi:hypothetical protein
MVKPYDQSLDVHAVITHSLRYGLFPFIYLNMFLSLLPFEPRTVSKSPMLHTSRIRNGPYCSSGAEWLLGITLAR